MNLCHILEIHTNILFYISLKFNYSISARASLTCSLCVHIVYCRGHTHSRYTKFVDSFRTTRKSEQQHPICCFFVCLSLFLFVLNDKCDPKCSEWAIHLNVLEMWRKKSSIVKIIQSHSWFNTNTHNNECQIDALNVSIIHWICCLSSSNWNSKESHDIFCRIKQNKK